MLFWCSTNGGASWSTTPQPPPTPPLYQLDTLHIWAPVVLTPPLAVVHGCLVGNPVVMGPAYTAPAAATTTSLPPRQVVGSGPAAAPPAVTDRRRRPPPPPVEEEPPLLSSSESDDNSEEEEVEEDD